MSLKASLASTLESRKAELEKVISSATRILNTSPEGCLEVINKDNHFRYYVKTSSKISSQKAKREYIKNMDLAGALANRDYAKQILKAATHELDQINSLLNVYHANTVEDCFNNLHSGRKCLVSPLVLDDDEYAKLWSASRNPIQNTYPKNTPMLTENNEVVRSKSEKIIADKLNIIGIPYKYEEAITLEGTIKFPDFTVLNKRNRKVYYWEHFGMIDKPGYLEKALAKAETYLRNNIILGKNLIISFETSKQPLSVQHIDLLIREYLL